MKIAPFIIIAVFPCLMASNSSRGQDTITNASSEGTPTNLVRQISSSDHAVVRYTFVYPPHLTNFSLTISGDRLRNLVGVVSSARRHYSTINSWGWEVQFYKSTNCLGTFRFQDSFFVADHGEYVDETGTLKKLYEDVMSKSHFDTGQ